MSRVSAIPVYIWLMLLFPSVAIAVVGAIRRTAVWLVPLSFSLTTVIVAAAESFCTVFVMQRFDQKFRDAPGAAFELSLFGDAVIGMLGVLLFGSALALFRRKDLASAPRSIYIGSVLGGVYSTLPNVFYWSRVDIPVVPFWIFALLFPILAARLTLQSMPTADAPSIRTPTTG